VSTFPGPGYEILPLMVAGTHPHPQVRISLTGNAAKYLIVVDVRELQAASAPLGPADESAATVGFRRLADMNPRHRLFLSALCLPLLTASGERGQVPTYAGIERILEDRGYRYKAKTIRNNLDDLRQWLSYEHDVPELLAADEGPAGAERVVDKLAHWAIRSGNVTDADLEWLEEHGTGGRGAGDDTSTQ